MREGKWEAGRRRDKVEGGEDVEGERLVAVDQEMERRKVR